MQPIAWDSVALLGIDIDGTLTDGFLFWAGPEAGWTQRYAVRDGEAILRLANKGMPIVPISRNKTRCAKVRMEGLKLPIEWVGVSDKEAALTEVSARYNLGVDTICYIGDGREDVPLLSRVGVGCSVSTGHPAAQQAARYVTTAPGGNAAVEEVIERIMQARGWIS